MLMASSSVHHEVEVSIVFIINIAAVPPLKLPITLQQKEQERIFYSKDSQM